MFHKGGRRWVFHTGKEVRCFIKRERGGVFHKRERGWGFIKDTNAHPMEKYEVLQEEKG